MPATRSSRKRAASPAPDPPTNKPNKKAKSDATKDVVDDALPAPQGNGIAARPSRSRAKVSRSLADDDSEAVAPTKTKGKAKRTAQKTKTADDQDDSAATTNGLKDDNTEAVVDEAGNPDQDVDQDPVNATGRAKRAKGAKKAIKTENDDEAADTNPDAGKSKGKAASSIKTEDVELDTTSTAGNPKKGKGKAVKSPVDSEDAKAGAAEENGADDVPAISKAQFAKKPKSLRIPVDEGCHLPSAYSVHIDSTDGIIYVSLFRMASD